MNAKRGFALLAILVLALGLLPSVGAQDGQNITVSLTPYESNPVLTYGEEGTWDAGGVGDPQVIYRDGEFHMLYLGKTGNRYKDLKVGMGYATSEDGLNWTKYEGNPVFVPDSSVAPYGFLSPLVMLDGDTWVLYFTLLNERGYADKVVLRATAPAPAGPWMVDAEPVFTAGDILSWEFEGPAVESMIRTEDGYVLYYCPMQTINPDGTSYNIASGAFGRATSPDGIHWTRYDNPTTTDTMHQFSDPVFVDDPTSTGWDSSYLSSPVVRKSGDGWEMFYAGADLTWGFHLGYATSPDGIAWTRYGDAPVINAILGNLGSVVVLDDGTYFVYYPTTTQAEWVSPSYVVYIAVATGTITRE